MGKIIFFSNRQEEPDNGLAQPYNSLRDWNGMDERKRPEFQDLKKRYPEGFSRRATNSIIAEQRRAIYPEAYDRNASDEYVERHSQSMVESALKPEVKTAPSFHDIPRRLFETIRQITHPRSMKAPSVGYIAGTKIKRERMPGVTRAEVRDGLRALLRYL